MLNRLVIVRWIRWLWYEKLTRDGRAFFIGCVLLAGGGMITLRVPIHYGFWAAAAIFAVAFLAGLVMRPRLEARGHIPAKTTVGEEIEVGVVLRNQSSVPIHGLGISVDGRLPEMVQTNVECRIPYLAPRGSGKLPLKLRAIRRGSYQVGGVRGWSDFPFGIFRFGSRILPPSQLLVLPKFDRLIGLDMGMGRRYQPGGIAMSADLGESPEYIGNRQYRPGDPLRHIDFKSWARLSEPAVREYQEEYYCRIALIVDTFVPKGVRPGPSGFPDLESVISLSASVADVLARGEYIVDLFAAGPDLYVFRSGRSLAHFDNILEVLACVDACRQSPFEEIAPALTDELNNITTVICVFMDWDKDREIFARTAVESGCATKIIIVKEGETTLDTGGAESWAGPITKVSPADIEGGRVDRL